MNNRLNPYQPTSGELASGFDRYTRGHFEWDGRRITVAAEQTALSLWQAAICVITIDDLQTYRFVKWRWNRKFDWTLVHRERTVAATLQCSGARTLRCCLLIDGVLVGDEMVSATGFWRGVAVTTSFVLATVWLLRFLLGG